MAEGTVDQDAGAMIRDGIKSIAQYGVCTESLWPYDISKFTNKPTNDCYKDAKSRRITKYERISSLDSARACLAQGYPFVTGIKIYQSFESAKVAKTGIVPMPGMFFDKLLGSHAIAVVGYDNSK